MSAAAKYIQGTETKGYKKDKLTSFIFKLVPNENLDR